MEEPANDNREAGVEPANDMVTCFVSGATIPRAEAIPVPLGRGQLVLRDRPEPVPRLDARDDHLRRVGGLGG